MIHSLTNIGPQSIGQRPLTGPNEAASGGAGFKNVLVDSIRQVNSMQQEANQAVEDLMTGGSTNPAEVLTAVQKADLAFRMMMQVRNKLMQAFQEIKDIRV